VLKVPTRLDGVGEPGVSGKELRWDKQADEGHQGELFAIWAANGLKSGASMEIKTDAASWSTGNVYIERECFVSGQWVPSGIDHRSTKSEIWAHVTIGPIVVFAPTAFVRKVAEKYGKPRELKETRTTHPTRGQVIPILQFIAELTRTGRAWTASDDELPLRLMSADPVAPFGRDGNGIPVAPFGYNEDRRVRLQPGGRRAGGKPVPDELPLWGDPGHSRFDDPPYEPPWTGPDGRDTGGEAA
jgi:hypothetical protein